MAPESSRDLIVDCQSHLFCPEIVKWQSHAISGEVAVRSGRLSFPKTASEGNEGGLIDGYSENTVCSRRPPQQGKKEISP